MNTFLRKVLDKLNISDEEYENMKSDVTLDNLEDPFAFYNIEDAVERINDAIENNEKIMVYGDYDCDGICATSILYYTFKKLGVNIGYYIPSRYKDGYGINDQMVDLIHSKGYNLIITVDNGVSQFSALKKAKDYGIDVILTDHHQLNEEIPECFCIVHPSLKDIKEEECGAYVAFMISILLLGEIDEYLMSLAALATISDMMPIRKINNRNLVRLALKSINKNRYEQFIKLTDNTVFFDEKSLSFGCAPKINALGRVIEDTKINKSVSFLTGSANDINTVYNLIIDSLNKRKEMTENAFKACNIDELKDDNVIVVLLDNVSEGVIGLVAQRVLNSLNKPCVIFTKIGNSSALKGSGRSLEGFNIAEAFGECDDILLTHGGHALAGGVSLEESCLNEFRQRMNKLCEGKILKPKQKFIIPLEKEEFSLENYYLLKSISPFGEGFEEPYFSYVISVNEIGTISNGKHIKGKINNETEFIGFSLGDTSFRNEKVTLIGKMDINEFRGNKKLNLKVEEIIQ